MIQTANRINRVEEYYFSRKLAEVRKLDAAGNMVINLGIGSPDLPPSAETIEALVASARQPANHGYQSYKGIPQLRKAICDFYQRIYSASLDPETQVLPLMGSKEGIWHISMAFLDEGDEVLVPDPGYPTYSSVTALTGGVVRKYSLKESHGWKIDVEALSKQDLSKVKIMWVNFPHMPTGISASREELKQLVDLAKTNKFLLVNDNPYSLILNDHPLSILSIEDSAEVVLELNSLSKSHNMAGWRLGWVAGKKEYIDAVLQVRSNMDSGMFLGIQHAAVEALQNGPEWFEALNRQYAERKEKACAIMDALDCAYLASQSGLFLWAKVPDQVADVEKWIDRILYEAHVFITPGFVFGEEGKRFIRLSLCAPANRLEEALNRIHQWKRKEAAMKKNTKSIEV